MGRAECGQRSLVTRAVAIATVLVVVAARAAEPAAPPSPPVAAFPAAPDAPPAPPDAPPAAPDVPPAPPAQPAPPAPSPSSPPAPAAPTPGANADVTPPKLLSRQEVIYPKGASGDAVVLLELVVTREGTVSECRAVNGDAPFTDIAIASARAFRFEPALRGGKPVAARIRFIVRFEAPVAAGAPPPPVRTLPTTPGTAPPTAVTPDVPGAIEVSVEGDRPEAAVSRFGRAEVRQLPGAFGDPFRAIEALPGVTPIISGLPYFFVRGAPPGNLGYFIDGVRVPLLYHVGAGPAVIHPSLVEKVDLHPGGYPARYGRFAGGIVAGETRAPAHEAHGEATLRIVDAGGLAEFPMFDRRATVLAAGRYGYPGLLLQLFAPEAILEYWDYQGRIAVDVTPKDTVSVFALGAYDFLGERRNGRTEASFATDFHRIDLRYDRRPAPGTEVRVAATVGLDRTTAEQELAIRDRMAGVRVELRHVLGPKATLRAGGDANADVYDVVIPRNEFDEFGEFDDRALDLQRAFPTRTDMVTGAWADVVLVAAPGVRVTPGLRADVYAADGQASVGVDPRISAEFDVTKKVRLIHAFGIAHQPPSFVIPLPGLDLPSTGLQTSAQHSFGVEVKLPGSFTGTLTAFQNAFFDLTDYAGAATLDGGSSTEETSFGQQPPALAPEEDRNDFEDQLNDRSFGRTVGLELYVRRPLTHRVGGYLSYTLSRSTRTNGTENRFPSNFDRTHVFQVAVTYDLGRRWRSGSRALFYTGIPIPGTRHSSSPDRLSPFYRIDIRLEKRWSLGKSGYFAFIAEMLNATLTKEAIDADEEIGPVTIPSLGIEASF